MNMDQIIDIVYILSATLFIFGLKWMGHPASARKGNLVSSLGMLIAIVVTLLSKGIIGYQFIIVGLIIGTIVGVLAARLVAMTSMPEMVAMLNGFGGFLLFLLGLSPIY